MSVNTQHRLRKHPDYQRVYKAARKQWARQIAYFSAVREPGSVSAQRSETAGPRVGLTVPKALGKAVDRNRIKRRLRAIVQQHVSTLGDLPVDVVLHPKRSVLEADFAVLQREVALIFNSVHAKVSRATPGPERGAGRA
jgi:ribonuclease P protein component